MKNVILSFAVLSIVGNVSFAVDGVDPQQTIPNGVNKDVVPTYQMPTGVTAKPDSTIQDAASKSSKNNSSGQVLGGVAMGVTGFGVAANCFAPPYANCGWWVAGLAASTVVTMNMASAKNKSNATLAAVTVGSGSGVGGDPTPTYGNSPEMQNAQDLLNKVKAAGYKVDMKTGNVTDPKGKTYNANMLGNTAAMQAAGMSASEMNNANAFAKNLQAAIDKKMKGADSTGAGGDMFGDTVGGGGGGAAPAKGAEGNAMDGMTTGYQNVIPVEERGPAQVAGLQKNIEGTPIGISQDNLFTMIGKRYQWCSDKGCFLNTVKP